MADMVWYASSCNQKLFVTLKHVGFQTLCLGRNVSYLEHQTLKKLSATKTRARVVAALL